MGSFTLTLAEVAARTDVLAVACSRCTRGGEGRDRHGGRAAALADLEWQSEERPEKHRSYPACHASFPGRPGQPEIDCAVAKALDGVTGVEQVFDRPERLPGELRANATAPG